ncbi:hypothetical protein ACSBR2_029377 [Camellia fascicularis]
MNSKSNSKATVMFNERDVVDTVRVRFRVPPNSSSSSSSSPCARDCCYTKFLLQNHLNFKRSASPAKIMRYEDGSWVDFAPEVVDWLRSGFVEGKSVVEVQIEGVRCLFDFHRMLQIDLTRGNRSSIAWIDVHGKCFFPETFVDGGGEVANVSRDPNIEVVNVSSSNPNIEISNVTEDLASENPTIEIGIRIGGDFNSAKRKGESETEGSSSNDQPGKKKKKKSPIRAYDAESPRWPKAKLLKEGEKAHSVVKNLFLSGIGVLEPGAAITAIHQWSRSGPLDRARYEVFQKQMEIMKAVRGEANMQFAWYGASDKGVASILSHGFALPNKFSGSEAHGIGIYLSPLRSSHTSAMLSEADDNGEKHVILCKVILGKCEQIEAGSTQMYPSCQDFDTGVDDLKNPNWYVVWCANMNTHILPECVVSYKSSDRAEGLFRGSSFVIPLPGSSNALLTNLLSKLRNSPPSSRVQELQTLWVTYKDGKVAKDAFMKQLRSIVGDEMLLSTIQEIRA